MLCIKRKESPEKGVWKVFSWTLKFIFFQSNSTGPAIIFKFASHYFLSIDYKDPGIHFKTTVQGGGVGWDFILKFIEKWQKKKWKNIVEYRWWNKGGGIKMVE